MQIQKINNGTNFRGNIEPKAQKNDNAVSENSAAKKSDFNPVVALSSLAGSVLPVLALSKIRTGKLGFDVFETGSLAKNYKTILGISLGGALGGLLGGIATAKKPEDKKAKAKESVFGFGKVLIPTTISTAVLALANKCKFSGKAPKIIAPIVGIGLGMPLCEKAMAKINDNVFEKDNPNKTPARKLKLKDYLVHVDDFFSLFVLSGVPIAQKVHADKILPLIYAWCGYEAGTKTAKEELQDAEVKA